MKGISVILAVSMFVIAASYATEAAISCAVVENNLKPCIGHLKSQDSQATPPADCCSGVKSVKAQADSTGERKAVCQCMKDMATKVGGINYDLAAKLASQCGVTMSYTINPNTDCSKV
ncbi:non-specific lipid-transfer protein-like [Silene latifolia]|uniref:non-specific lipid-transfer protein-like n=1 Tax=Silene latifolia TaxID=37657 RepID=UPI003D76DC27